MLSILNPASGAEPNAWAFLAGKDSVSTFIRNCGKVLYVLVLVAATALWVGLIWWFLAAPFENWWHGLLAAILLVLSQTPGWGEPFLERTGRWAPLWVIGPCAVYLLFLEPVGPLLFLTAIGCAWAVATVEVAANEWTEVPRWIRKVIAAVLRAVREATLLIAVGFAFALVTQIYVVIWSGFGQYAVWIWEGLVRPLSKLPSIKPKYVALAILPMMLLTLLDPRTGWVRRSLGAIKTYKRFVALFTAMASFTFYTSTSVDALHRQFLLERKRVHWQPSPAPVTQQAARRAAYIARRVELTTPAEKQRLAEELRRLPSAADREWAAREAAEAIAADLNAIGAESFENEGRETPQPTPQSESPASSAKPEAVYAECRQAVVSVFAGVLKSQAGTIDVGNDLLQSLADALLAAVAPAILDSIVPENLRDLRSIGQWMAKRLRRAPKMNIPSWNVEPDWNGLLRERGIELPKIRLIPKFAPGELSGKRVAEPSPRVLLP